MTGKVIAVANMKGGVGKTTLIVGLAEALAALGASVLVIDADAQANASVCLAGDARLVQLIDDGHTIDAFLDDVIIGGARMTFDDCIATNVSRVTHAGRPLRVSLLAASAGLRQLEREMIFRLTARGFGLDAIVGTLYRLFRHQLDRSRVAYQFVLIDCAPGISAVTEASIRLADLVIVPTIPDFLSTYGLRSFCQTIWQSDSSQSGEGPRRLPWVVASRRRPIREHDRVMAVLEDEKNQPAKSFELFKTVIPEAAAVAAGLFPPDEPIPFGRKWGQTFVGILDGLTREVREALRGA